MMIPSIDLFDGKAVQWRRGKEPVLERDDVFELLDDFRLFGDVAIVDLNAATGKGDNRALIERLLQVAPCRVGGGIRDLDTARAYLKAGASKLMIGTCAMEPWVKRLPRDAVIVALDSSGDTWLKNGWSEATGLSTDDAMVRLADRCSEFLYTQVEKEGMLQGLDRQRVERIVAASPIQVTVAGGVSSVDDIRYLHGLGAHAQVGMAVYTGRIDLVEAFLACVDFEKQALVPTIVIDDACAAILMQAYSNRASLEMALRRRRGVYFSRSREQLWVKGETSDHVQELVSVDLDCDGDSLLFRVRQSGRACHLPRWSCFARQHRDFDLQTLDEILRQRAHSGHAGSYTAKLLADPALRAAKLREETEELIAAPSFENARWEAADLIYFALVQARSMGVSVADIVNELRSRHEDS